MSPVAQAGLVFVGGGTGACLRFFTGLWVTNRFGLDFPYGTLVVNVLGSLAIGFLLGYGLKEPARLLLITGVLGGFTTYSSFSAESIGLMQSKTMGLALLYIALTLVLCLGSAALGMVSGQKLASGV